MPSSIVSPFPFFTDASGAPLEAGYIYIGQSNLNPETAPVNVFWDLALTIPAAQPIRTVGGYPSRNGSPSKFYVSNDTYSITVRDSRRAFVFSAFDQTDAPSSVFDISTQVITATAGQVTFTLTTFTYLPGTDTLQVYRNGLRLTSGTDYLESSTSTVTMTSPAAAGDEFLFQGGSVITGNSTPGTSVSFIQAGTGAVTRNMQDKARESVSAKDFGAVGDGVTDDTAAIQAAIDSLPSGGTVQIPCGNYKVTSALSVSIPGIVLAGENRSKSIITTTSATENVIVLNAGNVGISNLRIEHATTRTAGSSISITTNASKIFIEQVDIDSPFIGISIPSVAIARFEAVDINNAVASTGKSVVITGGYAINFVDCIFRNIQSARPFCHVEIQHVEDVVFNGCQMISGGINMNVTPGSGQAIGLLWCNNSQFDDASTASIRLAPATGGTVNEVTINSPWIKGTTSDVLATTAGGGTISSLQVSNSLLVGTGEGITSSGASNLILNGNKIGGHTTAISLTNTSGAVIAGNVIGAHGLYSGNALAVYLGGTTSNVIVSNNDMRSNVAGITDQSSNPAFNSFYYNTGVGGAIIPNSTPSIDWGIDFSKRNGFAIAASGSYDLAVGSGLVLLHNNTTGAMAMFLAFAGTVVKVAGDATIVSGSASANQIGLTYNSGSGKYRISNGYASSQDVYICTIKTRATS